MQRRHDDPSRHDSGHSDSLIDADTSAHEGEFWGNDRRWANRTASQPKVRRQRPASSGNSTGAIRIIRESLDAFRPHTVDGSGEIERTRSHGIVRPEVARTHDDGTRMHLDAPKPVADNELSVSDLGAGRTAAHALDAWADLDDWSELDAITTRQQQITRRRDRTGRVPRVSASHADHTRRHRSVDVPTGQRRPIMHEPVVEDSFFADSGDAVELELRDTATVRLAARVGLSGVDPLLLRVGALSLVTVLMVPALFSLGGSEPVDTLEQVSAPVAAESSATAPAAMASPSGASATAVEADVVAETPAPQQPTTTDAPSTEAVESSTSQSSSSSDSGAAAEASGAVGSQSTSAEARTEQSAASGAATVAEAAERIEPDCSLTYTAGPGDSWYRMADAAGVAPSELLAQNGATVDTVIFAGDTICLPAGATVPETPVTQPAETSTTSAPTTTDAPSTTTAPTTTAAPTTTTTTNAPSTPIGSPGRNATEDEVKEVIRSIFPESEWETAYEIARRESRFIPTAYNGWCCYGVFQIYWSVHSSWLDEIGITSSDDLKDPLLNVQAAYEIYQRAGNSWSPWSTYDG